jgi:hypothetical protein
MRRADEALLEALAALQRVFDRGGQAGMIIGGLAVIARGVPRHTVDIDATVSADGLDLPAFVDSLAEQGIVPRIEHALEFARDRQVLLLRHEPTGTPLEVSLAWLPFEHEALARATAVSFGGVKVRVATVEDLVIYKAVAWRDRDRADIERLLLLDDRMDLARVRALVKEFAEALEEPERVAQFDALVATARDLRGRG